jgi:hypothetical protein
MGIRVAMKCNNSKSVKIEIARNAASTTSQTHNEKCRQRERQKTQQRERTTHENANFGAVNTHVGRENEKGTYAFTSASAVIFIKRERWNLRS